MTGTEGPIAFRRIEGPKCAGCGAKTGLVVINDKAVLVESRGAIAGDTFVLVMHRCPKPPTNGRARR